MYRDASVMPSVGEDTRLLYLKDFHAAARHRTGYTTPEIFREDWLNEWLDSFGEERNVKQDYRFLYLGPAGSWTPLHADVFRHVVIHASLLELILME